MKEVPKSLVIRYQQKIFALVFYLSGNNRDKAYGVAVSSFVETIRSASLFETEDSFLTRLVSVVIRKSHDIRTIPSSDESDLTDFPPEKRNSLIITRRALQSLPFENQVLLLLRDQLHLAYKNIAGILRMSDENARIEITQARAHLREEIEKILNHTG
ncbi:MAG: sigma factor-like helix-turn-helix DNA-binding protein [Candidatus Omnitrophota bacterium]